VDDLKQTQRKENHKRPKTRAILRKREMIQWIKRACSIFAAQGGPKEPPEEGAREAAGKRPVRGNPELRKKLLRAAEKGLVGKHRKSRRGSAMEVATVVAMAAAKHKAGEPTTEGQREMTQPTPPPRASKARPQTARSRTYGKTKVGNLGSASTYSARGKPAW